MAETTADVRRDIELTRERMSSTLSQLERKMNVSQIVKDNPWPAVGVAFGAGLLLSGTKSDVKAGAVTLMATKGASSRIAPALDDIVARLMQGVGAALQGHVDTLIDDVKRAIGAPMDDDNASASGASSGASGRSFADTAGSASGYAGGSAGGSFAGGASGAYGASGSSLGTQGSDAGSSAFRG
jgi:hypothetical protein